MLRQRVRPRTYRAAGVDRRRKDTVLEALGDRIRSTHDAQVLGPQDTFAGLFRLAGFRDPVLVTSIDGAGTKVELARLLNGWPVVGADIVTHGANDVLCHGATPLFMLDYVAAARLQPDVVAGLLDGIVRACRDQGIALIGGETAEMPGVYAEHAADVVGCTVGAVERDRLLTGEAIRPGDVIIGIASDGLHTNGYSLARAALIPAGPAAARRVLAGRPRGWAESLGDALLRPHRPYARSVLPLRAHVEIRGIAHVTGGGIPANLVRILPAGTRARIRPESWPAPPLFALIQTSGRVADGEMFRTFNMGIGLLIVVPAEQASTAIAQLERAGERAWAVGRVEPGRREVKMHG